MSTTSLTTLPSSKASLTASIAALHPRFADDVKFFERCAECLCCSVFETFAPRPLPFVAPSHAHVNTPNTNNRARSVLLFARFVVVVKKFLDAIVVMLDARAFFCLLRPPLCFFVFVFLFFRLFFKKKKRRKKMHLVSWYPILLSRATTTRVQKQEMKNSSRRLGSFSFFGRRPSLRGSFFSLFPLLFVFFFFVFLFLSLSHPPLRLSTTTIKKKTKKKKNNNNNNAREKVVSIDATACARERERKKGRGGARDLSEIVGRVPAA